LLLALRKPHDAAYSDELIRDLVGAQTTQLVSTESIFILAFLPLLHRTVGRIAKQQAALSHDDIAQQALSFLLELLRANELQTRTSYFAFAISRALKRRMFEWARREGGFSGPPAADSNSLAAVVGTDSMERYAMLRHFLHRCVVKGLLSDAELDLLIRFKLGEKTVEEIAGSSSISSNAFRQKMKRLLSKLRRLAHD
jgi:DNA-directed RNA polymerase specialized sigma24 family protein